MPALKYFSYDPEGKDIEFFATPEEAQNDANRIIAQYRLSACQHQSGWNQEVEGVCWGQVIEQAKEYPIDSDTDDPDCETEYSDFQLCELEEAVNDTAAN